MASTDSKTKTKKPASTGSKKTATKSKTTSKKTIAAKTTTTKKVVETKPVEEKRIEEKGNSKNNNNVVKTILIIVALVLFFIIIFALNNNTTKGKYSESKVNTADTGAVNNVESESSNIKDDEKGDLTDIDIEDYLALKKGEEAAIIYIGRPTCSHCVIQKPIMEHMVYKYDVKVNYLNTDELSESDINKLQKSDDYFSEGWGTPLILVVKDNKIVDKKEGEASIEELTTMFKDNGLINE